MELWMKIGSAVLLLMMFFFILPRAKEMLKHSPKGSADDWRTAIIALGLVILFIWVLVKLV